MAHPSHLLGASLKTGERPSFALPQGSGDALLLARLARGRVEKKLGKDGRVLVRYSGTEPKVRVLVEGTDAKKIRAWAEEIGDSLRKALGE